MIARIVAALQLFLLVTAGAWAQGTSTSGTRKGPKALASEAAQLYADGRAAYYDGDYDIAERKLLRSLRFYRKVPGHDTLAAFAKTHYRLGDAYRHLRDQPAALATYDSAELYYRRVPGLDTLTLADIDLDRATVYAQMYEPKRALAAYEKVRSVYEAAYGPRSQKVAGLLMNAGTTVIKAGELRRAEGYYLEALDIFRETTDSTDADFNRIYGNIGRLYRKRGDYDRAVSYGKRALAMARANYGERHPTTAGAYSETSGVYADAGRLRKARRLLARATDIMADAYQPWHPYRVSLIYNAGRLEEEAGNADAALAAYRRSIRVHRASPEPETERTAASYQRIGLVLAERGDYPAALAAADSALQLVAPRLAALPTSPTAADRDAALLTVGSEAVTLDALTDLARIQLRAGRDYLPEALSTAELAVALIAQLRATFPTEAARRTLRESTADVYEIGVEAAQRLHELTGDEDYLRRVLELSAAGKSGTLRDHLREARIRALAGLPAAQGERLDVLQAALRKAKAAVAEAQTPEMMTDAEAAVARAATTLSEARTEVLVSYPRYASLQSSERTARLEEFRAGLRAGTVLLDYHAGVDGSLVVTAVSATAADTRFIAADSAYEAALRWVLRKQSIASSSPAARDTLATHLRLLYAHLISPVEALLDGASTLSISPSGGLHHLPFGMLVRPAGPGLNAEADYRRLDYLLRRFAVGYRGAPLPRDDFERESSSRGEALLAFAPSFEGLGSRAGLIAEARGELGALAHAADEVRGLERYFDTRALVGAEASATALREWGPRARMLHFATHGVLDDGEPLASGLYLSGGAGVNDLDASAPDFLSAADVYGLSLPSEMTVLSACHTAAGTLAAGEGALSLSRAFAFAGSRSVVASRWLANDRSTARVVDAFYAGLEEGLSRAEALRRAKLAYLDGADAVTAQPYYWAGLKLSGEDGPLAPGWGWERWGLLAAGLGIVGVGIWVMRRGRS